MTHWGLRNLRNYVFTTEWDLRNLRNYVLTIEWDLRNLRNYVSTTEWRLRNLRNHDLIITMDFPHCAKNRFRDSMKISAYVQESIYATQ